MLLEVILPSAFFVGLLGSVHCLGMCGGIIGALTLGIDAARRRSPSSLIPFLALYNAGRIASYTVAGAIAGGLGGLAMGLIEAEVAHRAGRLLASGFMIALGLYLAGWWPGLAVLERLGGRVWRHIEPAGRKFLPVRRPWQALGVGLVWGWLPCGLVYAALVWALTVQSAFGGALLMTAFGLGTLPMLLAAGAAAERLARCVRQRIVRIVAGLLVVSFGLYALFGSGGYHGGM